MCVCVFGGGESRVQIMHKPRALTKVKLLVCNNWDRLVLEMGPEFFC